MSIDRWLSLLAIFACIGVVLSLASKAVDWLLRWSDRQHSKPLARFSSRAIKAVFYATFTVVALAIWGGLLFNAVRSMIQPPPQIGDCRPEFDNRGQEISCD